MTIEGTAVRQRAPAPMLATLGRPPADAQAWAIEWKLDGQRGLVVIDDAVSVYSRNGADVSRTFPELLDGVPAAIGGRRVVLDGEIVAYDTEGRPSFQRLQQRWPQNRRPTPELLRRVPVQLCAFDVLAVDDVDITSWPYRRRREVLDALIVTKTRSLIVPRAWTDVSPTDMLDLAESHRVEGIVAKRLDSPYRAGRSNMWIKTPVRSTAELVLVAFLPAGGPQGSSSVGSIVLAGHTDTGQLVAVGQVGTGFSAAERRRLYQLLHPLQRCTAPVADPPEMRGVRWIEPAYVGEVAYRDYTPGGWLRHCSWKGLRDTAFDSVGLPA